jgi:hypothetical protein
MTLEEFLIRGWTGNDPYGFLAHNLKKVFCDIETEEDKALHNDMFRDIVAIVPDPGAFRMAVARIILDTAQARSLNDGQKDKRHAEGAGRKESSSKTGR